MYSRHQLVFTLVQLVECSGDARQTSVARPSFFRRPFVLIRGHPCPSVAFCSLTHEPLAGVIYEHLMDTRQNNLYLINRGMSEHV